VPSRNIIKTNIKDGYYHIYNRGVEKRTIFEDDQDYNVFLKYLNEYLSPPVKPEDLMRSFTLKGTTFQGLPHLNKNYFGKIDLLAYCLMPNHFHFEIKQLVEGSMEGFMRSLATRYSMYFNKKNGRVGTLFQGIYKACMIESDEYLLYLSRYIHLNPRELGKNIFEAHSSYADYLDIQKNSWVKTKEILSYFGKENHDFSKSVRTYQDFVEIDGNDTKTKILLGELLLED